MTQFYSTFGPLRLTHTAKNTTMPTRTIHPSRCTVHVYENDYVRAHMKAPRGQGAWVFNINGTLVTFSGLYTQARKAAVTNAKEVFSKQGTQLCMITLAA